MSGLYGGDILTLAGSLRDGALAAPTGTARKTAKLCGSEAEVDVRVEDGRIADFAQRIRACALGQASAAILAANVEGATCAEVRAARDQLHAMLKLDGDTPEGRFADLAKLREVKNYPARHASTLLPFEAAVAACGE